MVATKVSSNGNVLWNREQGSSFTVNLFYCPDGTLQETFCTEYAPFSYAIGKGHIPIPRGFGSKQECLDLQENQSGTIVDNNVIRWVYQADGNFVLYTSLGGFPIWSTGTSDKGGKLCYQFDSNLVIYNAAGVPDWSSGTVINDYTYLRIQDDCNVVMYGSDNESIWSTNTGCGN